MGILLKVVISAKTRKMGKLTNIHDNTRILPVLEHSEDKALSKGNGPKRVNNGPKRWNTRYLPISAKSP